MGLSTTAMFRFLNLQRKHPNAMAQPTRLLDQILLQTDLGPGSDVDVRFREQNGRR